MPSRPISYIIANQTLVLASPRTRVSEAAVMMKQSNVGAVLVVEGRHLAGIFTERDAVCRVIAAGLDPQQTPLGEVMTHKPQTIASDRPFGHALHIMYEGVFRHVPVVDRGELVGIVSARDALSADLAQFESDVVSREHVTEILG